MKFEFNVPILLRLYWKITELLIMLKQTLIKTKHQGCTFNYSIEDGYAKSVELLITAKANIVHLVIQLVIDCKSLHINCKL